MSLADAHLHLFRRGFPGVYGKSLLGPEVEAYESLRAAHAIEAGLVVGYQGFEADNNAYIRSLAADRPWIATVAFVDARAAPSPGAASALLEDGHVGIALYLGEMMDAEAARAWPAATWRLLDKRGAIVSLNVSPDVLAAFAPVVEANAGCAFLVSHMGLPGRYATPPSVGKAAERLDPLLRLAALPNVMVKISGAYAISDPAHAYPHEAAAPFVRVILERFGPERCVWGSDFSPVLDHVSFAQAVASPWLDRLGAGERDGVMGGNLKRLLSRARPSTPSAP